MEDLLRREPVVLDKTGLNDLLWQKVVLVTGAGGSIGSELCQKIGNFKPKLILAVDRSEYALYQLEQTLQSQKHPPSVQYLLADVQSPHDMDVIMGQHKPHVVFHAAAYKHVPMLEINNQMAGLKNNALGTKTVAEAAIRHAAAKFVLISTDKAVHPCNIMGASKRLAEQICQTLQRTTGFTQFIIVRFGNVLGSTGSVIPKLQRQIAAGGPLTITHPDITRFFMSLSEAAQLLLQASLMGRDAEIYVMNMGKPIRIVDMAHDLIRLTGLTPKDIPIQFTGLRPGEKLSEKLLADDETTQATPHSMLNVAKTAHPRTLNIKAFEQWLQHCPTKDITRQLHRWCPDYRPEVAATTP